MDWRASLARILGIPTQPVPAAKDVMGGHIAPPPQAVLRWYLSTWENSITAADTGVMQMAAQLARTMRRDAVIAGLLETRCGGLVRLPIRWSGDEQMVRELEGRDRKRGLFSTMCPTAELGKLSADGILLGWGVGEMLPVPGTEDLFVLRRLQPEYVTYLWAEDQWYYNSIRGRLPINPGVIREDGGWWVLHRPGGEGEPWDSGLWMSLGRSYIAKDHAIHMRENYSNKLVNSARVAVAPQGATEEQHQRWFQQVMAWGVNTVFGMKPGYDVKLVESNGRGYDVFQQTIEKSDREFMIALAGSTVLVDGGTGFANAGIHATIRADLIQATADALSQTINEQILLPYVNLRYGSAALDTAPVMEWDTSPSKDLGAAAQALMTAAQAVTQLNQALIPYDHRVDIHEIAGRFGIPLVDVEQPDVQPRESSPEGNEDPGPVPPPPAPAGPAPAPKAATRARDARGRFAPKRRRWPSSDEDLDLDPGDLEEEAA